MVKPGGSGSPRDVARFRWVYNAGTTLGTFEVNPGGGSGSDFKVGGFNLGSTLFHADPVNDKVTIRRQSASGVALEVNTGDTDLKGIYVDRTNVYNYLGVITPTLKSSTHANQILGNPSHTGAAVLWAEPGTSNSVVTIINGDVGIGGSGDWLYFRDSVGNVYHNFHNSTNVSLGWAFPGPYRVDINGACHATSFPTSSDERFKDDLTEIKPAIALNKLRKLHAYVFRWNSVYKSLGKTVKNYGRTSDYEIGLIAQEVEKVIPQLVTKWDFVNRKGPSRNFRAVDYGRMVALCVAAINELDRKIKLLEAKL
ncbi:MAG: tail fiber domain-containing protein [Planctomycetota bacterium]|nr:MAG: tail fiber domain-containing protein [Planctomycetota bacterium]